MTTLADDLRKTKREAINNELKEKADLLRFFVKSTLLEALQEAVKHGNEFAPVTAPKAIRHLFEMGYYSRGWDMENESSSFAPVWKELKQWAAEEGLFIGYAGEADSNNRPHAPSSEWEWQAYLGICPIPRPRPVQEAQIPEIPEPAKPIWKSPFFWGGMAMVITSFIFFLNQ